MRLSCFTNDLLRALQLVSRAIGTQQALPILSNILLEVEGKRCTVSATDLEFSIITGFEVKVENEGAITIPAKAILNFTQYNQDPEVLLETSEGTQLKCTSKHAKATIAGEVAGEYPSIAHVEKQSSFTLQTEPLIRALHLTTFASARTSLRPVLSGVSFYTSKNILTLVATDSYRLSEYKIPLQKNEVGIACIIPTKILEELRTTLGGRRGQKDEHEEKEGAEENKQKKERGTQPIEVILSKQQIEFHAGSTRLLSRLIDGKFPDYEQIIPQNAVTRVKFSTIELTAAVRRMHYFAKEMNNNLTFHFGKGQTRIITPPTQIGRDEAILTTEVSGQENKIALSSSYLLDLLSHLDGDEVEMQVTDSMHPAVFSLPKEKHFLHLIMPLRMQEE